MGTSSTRIERHNEGFQVDPRRSPNYFHSIQKGEHGVNNGTSKQRIDSSMSTLKVCSKEAFSLQEKLQNEFFTRWKEDCNVQEFHGFAISQMDNLLHKISDKFVINGKNIYSKLQGIRFCEEFDVNIYEFTFGEELSSGVVHFGMVAISKVNSALDAVSCLYTLNFEVAKVLVTKKRKKRFLGINAGTDRKSWYEPKSLGFVTQRALVNFCRYKALTEFKRKNFVSSINDVPSIDGI
ncbi:uncharacterized protein LOC133190870 [Saccostrea echinata]|uniref:uncharacterized protein LOC133190870 n=1 Tax=Saccostrea echinata TaxID=191078 RepID=UPI002A81DA40|nr:uncharacterized protein LOC133190870 [Saccostrea echinata]